MTTKILVSNDDGIAAPGVLTLVQELHRYKRKYDVRVVCPAQEQSAQSHSITITRPLWAEHYKLPEPISDVIAIQVGGTPADSVKIALKSDMLDGWKPDLVVSGINRGSNTGINTLVSGTVNAALEGSINDIPSIALSQQFHKGDGSAFVLAAELSITIIDAVIANGMDLFKRMCCNVNFPTRPIEEIKGWKICELGGLAWHDTYKEIPLTDEEKEEHPKRRMFRLGGKLLHEDDIKYDTSALLDGYITVTPLSLRLEAQDSLDASVSLKSWAVFDQKPQSVDAAPTTTTTTKST